MKPEQWGPPLWEELHRWSLTTDLPSAKAWLNRFWARVPCLKCKVGWFKLLTEHPPDFRSNQSLFAWSVAIHNAVNRHLGKPELTLQSARLRWAKMPSHEKTLVCTVLQYDRPPDGANLMLESARYHGIDVKIIGEGEKFENLYRSKIVRLYEAVGNLNGFDHILFIDGADTLFAAGLGEIFTKFAACGSDFVIAGEHYCYPFARRFEQRVPQPDKRFRFLNSGFYMATWDAWKKTMESMLNLLPDPYSEGGTTIENEDQARFYVAWLEGKINLTIDTDCRLCQCLNGTDGRWSWMSQDILWAKRPINKITNQAPCIFHCNGGEKWRMREIWEMLRT
jgi:Erv1 / Alr family